MVKVIRKKRSSRKARLPVSEAKVRWLALDSETLEEADAALKKRRPLQDILKEYPRLQRAWDRGRFLRKLRDLARKGLSVSKAAKRLGFASSQVLQTMIDEDIEIEDIWKQTRISIYVEKKEKERAALIEDVRKGNAAAIRTLSKILKLLEEERPRFDPYHMTIFQLAKITRKPTQTIHDWHTKYGLPKNPDGTFNFKTFFVWWEALLLSLWRLKPQKRNCP